jgi:hypothetical protein
MARINLGSMINWQNGQVVTAESVKQDREVMVTAINDNYNRVKELEDNTQISVPKEYAWEAIIDGQEEFTLPLGIEFPDVDFILEVSVEGFTLTEDEEFEKLSNTTIKINSFENGVSVGTRVYARWYEARSLKLFTDDLAIYNIMGVF